MCITVASTKKILLQLVYVAFAVQLQEQNTVVYNN